MSGNEQTTMPTSPFRPTTPCKTPSAFGERRYVTKDDYDRERVRWLGKIEDVEKRLMDAEHMNSSLAINKAELKKRIVDMEKNQKPMVDSNRKLNDKNKNLQKEIKKMEQKLVHCRDDFLTLKDVYQRLQKENTTLKEKTVSPEKFEELCRYRDKVLESSKCITALRTMSQEKDRRYEILMQRFRRLRKSLKKSENDEDRLSHVGSEFSTASAVLHDRIEEDFGEIFAKDSDGEAEYQALYRENIVLQRALNELQISNTDPSEESYLRDQINFANTTIEQQQLVIDATQGMMSQAAQLKATIASQQGKLRDMESIIEDLKSTIKAKCDNIEMVEFLMLEMEVERDLKNESVLIAEEEKGRLIKEVEELRKSHVAHLAEISAIRNELEDQKKNVPGSDHDEKVSLTQRLEKAEEANNTLNEEIRAASKELGKIRFQLQGSESSLAKERKMSEALSAQLQSVVSSSQEEALRKDEELKILRAKVEEQEAQMKTMKTEKNAADKRFKELEEEYAAFRADQRPEIRTELERRYEESKYRLNEALEQIHSYEKLIESGKKTGQQDGILNAKLSSELIQVKEFNSHLERQFLAQSEIIETLKQKLLKNRSFYERINKMVELEDASRIQEELVMFSRENNSDEGKLASNIALIIKDIRKNTFYSPLQISTTHHKIRPYSSVDSSAEWQSNSSEGIVSPDENDE